MNIHYFQHVHFEGLGCIEEWITQHHHHLTATKFYKNVIFPDINTIDFLIIMGGPMGVYDDEKFPWLISEKEFIKKAIEANKIVLGICLGAQLIADVLGAKVYPNKQKEIGWFPVSFHPSFETYSGIKPISNFNVFHWHGDTFDIPTGAINHSYSTACKNQLFSYKEKVIGIQYHLEATPQSIKSFVENGGDELKTKGEFIQSEKLILETTEYFKKTNESMFAILDKLAKK